MFTFHKNLTRKSRRTSTYSTQHASYNKARTVRALGALRVRFVRMVGHAEGVARRCEVSARGSGHSRVSAYGRVSIHQQHSCVAPRSG